MSAVATVTARCTFCNDWTTDRVGRALADVRAMHELICAPGGTVLVEQESNRTEVDEIMDEVEEALTPNGSTPQRRTCEEVAGCTRPTISDRGRYARVCAEHKDLVTARYRAAASGSSPSPEGAKREAVPPPAAEPEPIGRQAVDKNADDSASTLVELAQVVDTLSTRRRAMLAELDELEAELREAVSACSDALRACAVEEAA